MFGYFIEVGRCHIRFTLRQLFHIVNSTNLAGLIFQDQRLVMIVDDVLVAVAHLGGSLYRVPYSAKW
jgi:hypothetical protein